MIPLPQPIAASLSLRLRLSVRALAIKSSSDEVNGVVLAGVLFCDGGATVSHRRVPGQSSGTVRYSESDIICLFYIDE